MWGASTMELVPNGCHLDGVAVTAECVDQRREERKRGSGALEHQREDAHLGGHAEQLAQGLFVPLLVEDSGPGGPPPHPTTPTARAAGRRRRRRLLGPAANAAAVPGRGSGRARAYPVGPHPPGVGL